MAFVGAFVYYYSYSFLTLPFADKFWFGEIPLFALVQLPKEKLNDAVQDFLISLLPSLGLASGSPSPDMILTHPWALGVTVTTPGLILLIALVLMPRGLPKTTHLKCHCGRGDGCSRHVLV